MVHVHTNYFARKIERFHFVDMKFELHFNMYSDILHRSYLAVLTWFSRTFFLVASAERDLRQLYLINSNPSMTSILRKNISCLYRVRNSLNSTCLYSYFKEKPTFVSIYLDRDTWPYCFIRMGLLVQFPLMSIILVLSCISHIIGRDSLFHISKVITRPT